MGAVKIEMRKQERFLDEMVKLFQELDTNGSGSLSREELVRHFDDQRALAFFENLKLDITDVPLVFELIDLDNSGDLNVQEFVGGCQKLRGEARTLDVLVMQREIRSWIKQSSGFEHATDTRLQALQVQLDAMADRMGMMGQGVR